MPMKSYLRVLSLSLVLVCSVSSNALEINPEYETSGEIVLRGAYADAEEFGSDDSVSDFNVEELAAQLDIKLIDDVSVTISTLYKEDEVDLNINEAYLQLANLDGNKQLTATLGKIYVPFGQYTTNQVNDSLVETLIATEDSVGFRQTVLMLSWQQGEFGIDTYVFDSREDEENELSDVGIRFSYGTDETGFNIDYLSDVSDSVLILEALAALPSDELSAISVNGTWQIDAFTIVAEHVATDDLDEIGFVSTDAPTVSQLDVGYAVNDRLTVALGYQQTDEAAILGLPETRITTGITTSIYEGLIEVGVELWQEQDYDASEGGTDDDITGLTFQFAVGF